MIISIFKLKEICKLYANKIMIIILKFNVYEVKKLNTKMKTSSINPN
jgi:hypothetical protein